MFSGGSSAEPAARETLAYRFNPASLSSVTNAARHVVVLDLSRGFCTE
jgi:hypothetical protein